MSSEYKYIHIQHVRGHSGVGPNCLVDELINVGWTQSRKKIDKQKIGQTPTTHCVVTKMIKKRIEKDENEHRNQLGQRHESVSSRNMKILGLNRENIQNIIKSLSSSRSAQSTFMELMTDTAGRIGCTRLKYPRCDEDLTLDRSYTDKVPRDSRRTN